MQSYLSTAIDIAREAGALLAELFEHPQEISYKRKSDLVTEADRRSEALIVKRLRTSFPEHAVVGEEVEGKKRTLTIVGTSIRWMGRQTSPTASLSFA